MFLQVHGISYSNNGINTQTFAMSSEQYDALQMVAIAIPRLIVEIEHKQKDHIIPIGPNVCRNLRLKLAWVYKYLIVSGYIV